MKKILLLTTILLVSVFSTSCINNAAIQTLNDNAQDFIQKGDYKSAISRLESSLDLDPNILETRYNLAVAYISDEQYDKAKDNLLEATLLKPEFADAQYSLGVTLEYIAYDILDGDSDGSDSSKVEVEVQEYDDDVKNISEADAKSFVDNLNASIDAYKKYLVLSPSASDKSDVEDKIVELSEESLKYATKYDLVNVEKK